MAGNGAEAYRKRLEQAAQLKAGGTPESAGYKLPEGLGAAESDEALKRKRKFTAEQKADYLIRDAMNRGEFDNLRYAGKPIPGLDDPDPDWWIKRLIKRENISGLGPPALTLRVEDEGFDGRMDALPSERQMREAVEDFNARVIDARRQLLGGPPVITKLRDVEDEVRRWRQRRGLSAAADAARDANAEDITATEERRGPAHNDAGAGRRVWLTGRVHNLRKRLPGWLTGRSRQ